MPNIVSLLLTAKYYSNDTIRLHIKVLSQSPSLKYLSCIYKNLCPTAAKLAICDLKNLIWADILIKIRISEQNVWPKARPCQATHIQCYALLPSTTGLTAKSTMMMHSLVIALKIQAAMNDKLSVNSYGSQDEWD